MDNATKIKKIVSKLPSKPGVYFFLGEKRKILYIGKATSLKNRVISYFGKNLEEKRSPLIAKMVTETKNIRFQTTDSVLEALILESYLIKKNSPPYNSTDKDQKSFNYVVITDEIFPRVLIMRERELKFSKQKIKYDFGPFPHGKELREALKIIRKIFPFRDKCKLGDKTPCFNYQIGLCPGTCIGLVTPKEYQKNIRHLVTFFQGKKKQLQKNLVKEMQNLAKANKFEEANIIKRKIFAINHINDVSILSHTKEKNGGFRIEAYDISHISGSNMVGVMTVVENGIVKKDDYRIFKPKGLSSALGKGKPDDVAALAEILRRRLQHSEWAIPNIIVVDGSTAQINSAKKELALMSLNIPVVCVTKDEKYKAREVRGETGEENILAQKYKKEIILANSESHRFAIRHHRQSRQKSFIQK